MAHQHQKDHTVPKQVIMIATSIQVSTVLRTALCESLDIMPSLNKMSDKTWYPECATRRLLSYTPLNIEVQAKRHNTSGIGEHLKASDHKAKVLKRGNTQKRPSRATKKLPTINRPENGYPTHHPEDLLIWPRRVTRVTWTHAIMHSMPWWFQWDAQGLGTKYVYPIFKNWSECGMAIFYGE